MGNQLSSEGELVEIDRSESGKLPQIWNQYKETPSSSTAIMSLSARDGGGDDLPVENEIRVRSDL